MLSPLLQAAICCERLDKSPHPLVMQLYQQFAMAGVTRYPIGLPVGAVGV